MFANKGTLNGYIILDCWRVETIVNSTQMVINWCNLFCPSKICPLKGEMHTPITMLQAKQLPVSSRQTCRFLQSLEVFSGHSESASPKHRSFTKHPRPSELVLSYLWTQRCEPGILSQHKCLVDRRLVDITMPGESWHKPAGGSSTTTWGKKTSRKLEGFALANQEFPSEIQWISKHFHPGLASHGNR